MSPVEGCACKVCETSRALEFAKSVPGTSTQALVALGAAHDLALAKAHDAGVARCKRFFGEPSE